MIRPAGSAHERGGGRYRQSAHEYRLRSPERSVDTVIALQNMPVSRSNPGRTLLMPDVRAKEAHFSAFKCDGRFDGTEALHDRRAPRFPSKRYPSIDNRVGVRLKPSRSIEDYR